MVPQLHFFKFSHQAPFYLKKAVMPFFFYSIGYFQKKRSAKLAIRCLFTDSLNSLGKRQVGHLETYNYDQCSAR